MEYMESKMQDQLEGSMSQFEEMCHEAEYLNELVVWAYSKLHTKEFSNMEDALMLDRMKLWAEHRIAG